MSIFTITWSTQVYNLMPPIMRGVSLSNNGSDFSIGIQLSNYIYWIVMSSPGHWKNKPTLGVNLWQWIQSGNNVDQLKALILNQLNNDIFSNPYVDLTKFPIVAINDVTFSPIANG